MATSCSSCGATLAPDDVACDLCGTPAADVGPIDTAPTVAATAPTATASGTQICTECGHAVPAGSRFCNACGAPTHAAPPPEATSAPRPSSDVGRRGLAVIAVGVVAVMVLYGWTLLSDEPAPASELEQPAGDVADLGDAPPIPEGAPPLPDSLQTAADQFAAQSTADGWYESARYYLTAAFGAVQTDPESSVRWARRAIVDFEKSLAIEESPRVRVALAEAATFDPSDPMRPIQELRAVLEADPDNIDATFLLGERRMMIGRTDQARESFERVLELAPVGSPARARAEAALASLAAE